jgi:hypothetical protein
LKLHKEVFLKTDIFFVNKIPFFLKFSRKICFTADQYYLQRGFHITPVHADGEFAPLKTLIEAMPGGPMANLVSAHEHVPEIERRIWVVKERYRSTRHSLPFHTIPKLMTIHIVLNVVKLLIFFQPRGEFLTL